MSETLTALDATFLELEQIDQGATMHIGGVMVFDPLPDGSTPTVERLRSSLGERLGELPRYSQRLSSRRTGSFAWPHWEPDEQFDISDHVRRASLPAPGTEAQLLDWAADFFSHPLDRARPLWENVLIEGLEDGRWALATKTHHCLVDGVGSVDVVNLILDEEPEPASRSTPPVPALASRNGARRVLPEPVVQATGAGLQAASAGISAVRHPASALASSRALAELIVRDTVHPAPRTSLNVPIGQTRRFAVVRVPLAEVKAIGRDLDGSVNDVILAACATGLRHLLNTRGEHLPLQGVRAMVPMNLRDASGELTLGNRVTSLFVDLPVAEPVPHARLRAIHTETQRLKGSGAGKGATTLMDLAALAPPIIIHAALAQTQFSSRAFNLTITNVPGPQRPLYAHGALLRELYPLVPLAAEHAVGIAIFSYNGLLSIGINADCESMPDLAELAYGIEQGIEQLRALSPSAAQLRD
jgi:diacylglycerol O-acyltransferase / wax synthase